MPRADTLHIVLIIVCSDSTQDTWDVPCTLYIPHSVHKVFDHFVFAPS